MQQADLSDMFKYALKSVCISIIAVIPDPPSPNPSTSLAMKTSETQKRTLKTLNQNMKRYSNPLNDGAVQIYEQ